MGAGVAFWDVAAGEDLVGEFGACFEGEGLGEDEGVVTVEEESCDLWEVSGGRVIRKRVQVWREWMMQVVGEKSGGKQPWEPS